MCCNLPFCADSENRIQRIEHVTTEQTCGGTGQGIGHSGHERYKVEGKWQRVARARDAFQGKGMVAYPYCSVQCLSRETAGRRPGYKRESLDYQRNCFVYTAEKALLNTQETKEIWWWRRWCETGIHQGEDNYRNVTTELNGSVSAFVAGIRSVCRKNQELWHHI
jgi:hypothetical protein